MDDMPDSTLPSPQGHPLIATLAGAALLMLAALIGPHLIAQQPLAHLLVGGAALGLGLWLVALLVSVRRAPIVWILGSLVLLVAAGLGAGLIAHGQYQTGARADASSFAEIEFAPDGAPQLPAGIAGRGPISRLYAEKVQAEAAEQREFAAALGQFGIGNLNSPYLLSQDAHAIANCAAIDAIKATAQSQADKRAARNAVLARAIAAASLPDDAKQGIAALAGAQPGTRGDPLLANQQAMLDASKTLCTLLARRTWFNDGGFFGFRNGADKAAFDAIGKRRQAIAAEGDALTKAERARLVEGRDAVRDALSRSIYG